MYFQLDGITISVIVFFSICAAFIPYLIIKNLTKEDWIKKIAFVQGFLEILIFSFSILINIPLFIAFWISVKTAIKWTEKQKSMPPFAKAHDVHITEENKKNKLAYMRFLIGNIINIILGYIIASVIRDEIIIF